MRTSSEGVAAFAIVLGAIALDAQTTQPRFEVASVKPTEYVNGPAILDIPPRGAVTATNYPVLSLVYYAFGVKHKFQLSGNPDWLWSERFAIKALPPEDASRDQIPQMMRALLEDRFRLRVHWETRDQPIYALVVARADGRLGPNLKPSKHDCAAFLATGAKAYEPGAPRDEQGRMLCGGATIPIGRNVIGGAPISDLVEWLNTWAGSYAGVDRVVVDETGLKGNFDIEVTFAPVGWAGWKDRAAQSDDPPEIHQAFQEQLGLKLESRRAPALVLVIDRVERPTPD